MKRTMILATLATATSFGCTGNTLDEPSDALIDSEHTESAATACVVEHERLTVMTQNVYLGADIDPVLAAQTVEQVPVAVAAAWAQLEANRFEERAAAIAESIARGRPQLVGLQEVALFRRFPHDGAAPLEIDFLAILQRALAAKHVHYVAAAVQQDSDVQLPMLSGIDASGEPFFDGVQMIDRDVVLVRADVRVSDAKSARFAVGMPLSIDGNHFEIVRGWASVVVSTDEGPLRFITTHLEDHVPEIQAAQAAELLAMTGAEPLPIVLAGDFNSPADGSQTPTYGVIAAAGFSDAWTAAHPGRPGYTCCRAADLRVDSKLTQRLDIVFARGRSTSGFRGKVAAVLVGESPRDRTRSGSWPSDHAGVLATFRAPPSW